MIIWLPTILILSVKSIWCLLTRSRVFLFYIRAGLRQRPQFCILCRLFFSRRGSHACFNPTAGQRSCLRRCRRSCVPVASVTVSVLHKTRNPTVLRNVRFVRLKLSAPSVVRLHSCSRPCSNYRILRVVFVVCLRPRSSLVAVNERGLLRARLSPRARGPLSMMHFAANRRPNNVLLLVRPKFTILRPGRELCCATSSVQPSPFEFLATARRRGRTGCYCQPVLKPSVTFVFFPLSPGH